MQSAINQHNYEEFFLLYVDGELSATDKLAVEQFVQENPVLAIELEMLQQVQLIDEPIFFSDKHSLLRSEATEINLNNYEEQFLLYVDNELSKDEKEKVETFVLQHPVLQDSFTILKQTKLPQEAVLFANKESLYRKEEKERPVFYMRWQRMAVAAAILGFAVITWMVLPANKEAEQVIANGPKQTVPNTNKQDAVNGNNNANAELIASHTAPASVTVIAPINKTVVSGNKITAALPAVVIDNNLAETNTLIAKNDPPVTERIETSRGAIVETPAAGSFNTRANTQTTAISEGTALVENHPVAVKNSNTNNADNIHSAVYKELDTDNEEKSLLLGSLEINKDKLRGFFRKAGSLFRSKSKTEDEKTESAPSSNTRSLE